MKNKFKKIVATVAAIAVALTTVVVTDVTTAKAADWESLYTSSSAETATAGVETPYTFSLDKTGNVSILIYAADAVNATLTLYNSAGVPVAYDNNPLSIRSSDWTYVDGVYGYDDVYQNLAVGDYTYGIKFDSATTYMLDIAREKDTAKISESKATVTVGFTKKLSVSGSKVKTWSSSKKAVATVDKNGKVTAKKAGKTTISAKCENGQTVKCTVTVKANKYSGRKLTVSDVSYGNSAMSAYAASFDSKGNLVIKVKYVNNIGYKVSSLKNIKIVVRDGNKKLVGTYKASKKNMSVASGSTKDLSFTISKSQLKKKTVDLRNASITCDGISQYVVYY